MLMLFLYGPGFVRGPHGLLQIQQSVIASMNFETNQPFDQQLGRLLAIIIMSEKKIQELRKKLAGNQQFHTRLIFNRMDLRSKGEVTAEDIVYTLAPLSKTIGLKACQNLCRKFSVSGAFSYQELLSLMTPKTDKALTQRMLLRIAKRGAVLPDYLWRNFCQLLTSLISMASITEEMKKKIQNCTELNHLEMLEFFKRVLKSPQAIWRFCNQNTDLEYDFTVQDTRYLSNNLRSGNELRDMTQEDIKELICPLDMNFQKTMHEMAPYYEDLKAEKQRTLNGAFFTQLKTNQQAERFNSTNFLSKTYQSLYPHNRRSKENIQLNFEQARQEPQVVRYDINARPESMKAARPIDGSGLYLDQFIKPVPFESDRPQIELDRFLSGRYSGANKGFEKFEDALPENGDSSYSNSAFIQY